MSWILLFIFAALIAIAAYLASPKRYAPGPIIFPFIGSPQSWIPVYVRGELYQEILKFTKKYGLCYQVMPPSFSPMYSFVVSDPTLISKIANDATNFTERLSTSAMKYLVPNGMLNLETGDKWKLHRKLEERIISSGELMRSFTATMDRVAGKMVSKIKPNETNELGRLFVAYTFDTISECAFGHRANTVDDPDNKFAKAFKSVFKYLVLMMAVPQIILRIIRKRQEFDAIKKDLRKFVADAKTSVEKNQADADAKTSVGKNQAERPPNVFDEMTKSEEEIPQEDAIDESLTLMIGGHETTGHTLAWTAEFLANNPECQDKAYEEVRKFHEDEKKSIDEKLIKSSKFPVPTTKTAPSELPSEEEFPKLPYLEAVILESLRLRPTLPAFIRYCRIQQTLVGSDGKSYTFPPGSRIAIGLPGCNMSEKFWDDPHTFNPERFSTLEKKDFVKRGFYPFGTGKRMCLGPKFALAESLIILSKLLLEYELRPSKDAPKSEGRTFITLSPEKGVYVDCIPRKKHVE